MFNSISIRLFKHSSMHLTYKVSIATSTVNILLTWQCILRIRVNQFDRAFNIKLLHFSMRRMIKEVEEVEYHLCIGSATSGRGRSRISRALSRASKVPGRRLSETLRKGTGPQAAFMRREDGPPRGERPVGRAGRKTAQAAFS